VEQQLAVAAWLVLRKKSSLPVGRDVHVHEPGFAPFHPDEAVNQRAASGAQALYFGSGEYEASLESVLD
jgi:hypothetical protein